MLLIYYSSCFYKKSFKESYYWHLLNLSNLGTTKKLLILNKKLFYDKKITIIVAITCNSFTSWNNNPHPGKKLSWENFPSKMNPENLNNVYTE